MSDDIKERRDLAFKFVMGTLSLDESDRLNGLVSRIHSDLKRVAQLDEFMRESEKKMAGWMGEKEKIVARSVAGEDSNPDFEKLLSSWGEMGESK